MPPPQTGLTLARPPKTTNGFVAGICEDRGEHSQAAKEWKCCAEGLGLAFEERHWTVFRGNSGQLCFKRFSPNLNILGCFWIPPKNEAFGCAKVSQRVTIC